jgi:transposase
VIDSSAITEFVDGLPPEKEEAIRRTFARALTERDEFRKLYLILVEENERLKRGLLGQKAERLPKDDAQLTLEILGMMLGAQGESTAPPTMPPPVLQTIPEHTRRKPVRKPLPEDVVHADFDVVPPEVVKEGTDYYERISVTTSETLERRPASVVVVRINRPKFVRKGGPRPGEPAVLQAPPPEVPIPRAKVGPGFLAETLIRRFDDHLPLNRLEKIYEREGLDIPRSTICGWHIELAGLAEPVVSAMRKDALRQPYLCTDATGVLVQAKQKCRTGHFWVLVAPERHVLFEFSAKHDSAAVDALLAGYEGTLVADAHSVYDHLFENGKVVEAGCWAHVRRYYFKSLGSDPERARTALAIIGALFEIERRIAKASVEERLAVRRAHSASLVDEFFSWCKRESARVLDDTPISKGIGYALNQREALRRFLEDGRLPIHNNWSELQLRREVIGRKNWLFVGSEDGAHANTTFVSLLASCAMHRIPPWEYLLDLFCLLPSWPRSRAIELAPAYWAKTRDHPDVQAKLDENIFRGVALGRHMDKFVMKPP